MVRANPQDWPGYEVREFAVIPAGHVVVSEGLLRRLCEPLLSHADYVVARNELRALLSEQA